MDLYFLYGTLHCVLSRDYYTVHTLISGDCGGGDSH
jgi:hypothetical protein